MFKEMEQRHSYIQELQLERVFLAVPGYAVKMIITIEGKIEQDLLNIAVEKTGRRHPLLQSKAVLREDGSAYFTNKDVKPVRAELREKKDMDDYASIIHSEDKKPLDVFSEPAMRVLFLNSGDTSEIILYVNHTVCDGRSLVYITRDLLEYLADPDNGVALMPPVNTGDSMPDIKLNAQLKWLIQKVNKKWVNKKIFFEKCLFREAWLRVYEHRDNFEHLNYSEEETSLLKKTCKASTLALPSKKSHKRRSSVRESGSSSTISVET